MTDHLSFDILCDLADGELASDDAARAHVAVCRDCADRLASLAALATDVAALPREIAPPPELWTSIRGELTPRTGVAAVRPAPRWTRFAAAAVLLVVASSGITALLMRGGRSEQIVTAAPTVTVPSSTTAGLPAELASTERDYVRRSAELQQMLDQRRDSLAPSTVVVVERSLRIADSAIAEAREALARDPANRALAEIFASNHERKIELLERASELARRT
jgi:hypothetical protein